jgi:serine phosphatase RsbU (regulator of sigma subunit)
MIHLEFHCGDDLWRVQRPNGTYILGRSPECDIQLSSRHVSRRHAQLRVDGARLFVRDLQSMFGTAVDRSVIGDEEVEVPLRSIIGLADVLVHRVGEAEPTDRSPFRATESCVGGVFEPGGHFTERAKGRVFDALATLLEVLGSSGDALELGRRACRFVGELLRADRVFAELRSESGALEPLADWTRTADPSRVPCLSQGILERVLEDRHSVRVPRISEDSRFRGRDSCRFMSSVMAAPLFDNQRVLGILYLDSADESLHYSQDDLQVFTAVANAIATRLRSISLEVDLRAAARFQEVMLPRRLPDIAGYDLAANWLICKQVGGDVCQCVHRADGSYMLALGDIAGKGMPAALGMAATTLLLRLLARLMYPPEQVVEILHQQLHESFAVDEQGTIEQQQSVEEYLTLALVELRPEQGRLLYVNAGHVRPRIVRARGGLELLEPTAFPVGLLKDVDASGGDAQLDPGDLLAIASDGIPEATSDGERFYGEERFDALLLEGSQQPLQELGNRILQDVKVFVGPDGVSDDVSLVLLRRHALARTPEQRPSSSRH